MAMLVELFIHRSKLAKFLDNPRDIQAFEQMQGVVAGTPDDIAAETTARTASIAAEAAARVAAVAAETAARIAAVAAEAAARIAADATKAAIAGQAFTGLISAPNITTPGTLDAGALKLPAAGLAATVTASDHSVPVDIGGTIYYIRLSATP